MAGAVWHSIVTTGQSASPTFAAASEATRDGATLRRLVVAGLFAFGTCRFMLGDDGRCVVLGGAGG